MAHSRLRVPTRRPSWIFRSAVVQQKTPDKPGSRACLAWVSFWSTG